MLKRIAVVFIVLTILFSSSACGDDADVKDVLSKMRAHEIDAPAGRVYLSDAEPGNDEYISDSLIKALFKGKDELAVIESYALRLSSFATPYEYAVFKAKTVDDTDEIAKMCYMRINTAKTLLNRDGEPSRSAVADSAAVHITGKYVIYAMTDDNDRFIDAAKKALG